MPTIDRTGFGVVEPNHLSAQRTGQIYAQLPVDKSITLLENGQFVKYNYAENKVDLTGKGEWMLVFNEYKSYDERQRSYRDFAMKREDYVDSEMTPRVFKTNIGDIFTTNTLDKAQTDRLAKVTGTSEISVQDILEVDESTGYLKKVESGTEGNMQWQVVKLYTMPDGQPGVKIMRIA